MGMLQFYIYANIYILVLFVIYWFFMRRKNSHGINRLYIILGFLFTLSISIFQEKLSGWIIKDEIYFKNLENLNIIYLFAEHSNRFTPALSGKTFFNWNIIINTLIFLGFGVTMMHFIFQHLEIWKLIKKSEKAKVKNSKVVLTDEEITPFSYFRYIVIPNNLTKVERNLIIRHEVLHQKYLHHIDVFLLQILQAVFWLNPFFYFLKRQLILVHEFQVDRGVIQQGIDAIIYKLTLLKYSVGSQKFAVANGLINSQIKKRIIMLNNNSKIKGKWNFIYGIPILAVVFLMFSFSNIKQDTAVIKTIQESNFGFNVDSMEVELVYIKQDELNNEQFKNYFYVLMNVKSQLMVDGEFATLDNVARMVSHSFLSRLESVSANLNMSGSDYPKVNVVVQKDRGANSEDYEMMLERVSSAIFVVLDTYSEKMYGKSYGNLTGDEKVKLEKVIEQKIYIAEPKVINQRN